jgi:hypothetical protein
MRKLLFLLTSTAFIACDQGNVSNASLQIMPLSLTNRWIGLVSEYDAKGNVVSSRQDTLAIDKVEHVNGEDWYYMNVFDFFTGRDTARYAFTNRIDGLYRCDSGDYRNATLIAKYPAKSGDTISFVWDRQPDSTWLYYTNHYAMVDTTGFEVSVPAGTFKTWVYRAGGESRNYDVIMNVMGPGTYYSPSIGPVQYGYFMTDGKTLEDTPQIIWQLVRADLH